MSKILLQHFEHHATDWQIFTFLGGWKLLSSQFTNQPPLNSNSTQWDDDEIFQEIDEFEFNVFHDCWGWKSNNHETLTNSFNSSHYVKNNVDV